MTRGLLLIIAAGLGSAAQAEEEDTGSSVLETRDGIKTEASGPEAGANGIGLTAISSRPDDIFRAGPFRPVFCHEPAFVQLINDQSLQHTMNNYFRKLSGQFSYDVELGKNISELLLLNLFCRFRGNLTPKEMIDEVYTEPDAFLFSPTTLSIRYVHLDTTPCGKEIQFLVDHCGVRELEFLRVSGLDEQVLMGSQLKGLEKLKIAHCPGTRFALPFRFRGLETYVFKGLDSELSPRFNLGPGLLIKMAMSSIKRIETYNIKFTSKHTESLLDIFEGGIFQYKGMLIPSPEDD